MLQLLTTGPRECGSGRDAEPTKTLCGSVGNGETGGTAQFMRRLVIYITRELVLESPRRRRVCGRRWWRFDLPG